MIESMKRLTAARAVWVSACALALGSMACSSTTSAGDTGPTGTDAGGADAGGPRQDAGTGQCACFMHGRWALENLSPCLYDSGGGVGTAGATSSVLEGGQIHCPIDGMQPAEPWSTSKLTTDCTGHFRLCFALKAGDPQHPQPSDCTLIQDCSESDYTTPNQPQTWSPLPSWKAASPTDTACAMQFAQGGYGEMSVEGTTPTNCHFAKTLAKVPYCPLRCNLSPNTPECMACRPGMDVGSF